MCPCPRLYCIWSSQPSGNVRLKKAKRRKQEAVKPSQGLHIAIWFYNASIEIGPRCRWRESDWIVQAFYENATTTCNVMFRTSCNVMFRTTSKLHMSYLWYLSMTLAFDKETRVLYATRLLVIIRTLFKLQCMWKCSNDFWCYSPEIVKLHSALCSRFSPISNWISSRRFYTIERQHDAYVN